MFMKAEKPTSYNLSGRHEIKKYCIAGTGARGMCYAKAMNDDFGHCASLVSLLDHNALRAQAFSSFLKNPVSIYADFETMVKSVKVDCMIICTPDYTHDSFIEMAFRNGIEVIVEKPLTVSEEKVRRIALLERQYGKKVRVTFNLRYATYSERLKKTLLKEDIGEIRSISLDWFLDKVHGTEYFRRWHAHMAFSGGLLVHKSTHHFDLVNWLIDDIPTSVTAAGSLQIFGAKGIFRGKNCRSCMHISKCPFYYNVRAWDDDGREKMQKLYFDSESADGYIRDNCVFRKDIDIYDTMNAIVNYRRGAQMSYTLTAYAPYEGYRLVFTGTRGRIEAEELFGGIMMFSKEQTSRIRVITASNRKDIDIRNIEFESDKSEHGGGDRNIYRSLFEANTPDPLGQTAGFGDGAMSCLIGICANRSILEKRLVQIPDFSKN